MKKFLTVLLWMGLAASLTMLYAVNSQKNALVQAENSAVQKSETIQAQYEEAKSQLDEAIGAKKTLADEKAALEAQLRQTSAALEAARLEVESLAQDEREARQALETARQAWEEERQALTAEKDAADSRLAETLTVLRPDVPAADAPTAPEENQALVSPNRVETVIPSSGNIPEKRDEADSLFRLLDLRDEAVTEQPVLP